METQIETYFSLNKEQNLTNQYVIIGKELYQCTKQSKLYLFLNKLTSDQKARLPTDIIFNSFNGDNIEYYKYNPIVSEEKIKMLTSKTGTIHKIDNINFDYYYKINTSDSYGKKINYIKTDDEYNTDIKNNCIITAYREYYSIVDKLTNIYGKKTDGYKYYESFMEKYAKRLLHHITTQTDEYIYNLVGDNLKQFKHEEIKPVLEHLRNYIKQN